MTSSSGAPVALPWDYRFEKFGVDPTIVDYLIDFGITFSIGQNKYGIDILVISMEHVTLRTCVDAEKSTVFGLQVDIDEGCGTAKIELPPRSVFGGFGEAIDTLIVKQNPKTGESTLEQGPKNAHSGIFFFHILSIDDPRYIMKFQGRSDFNDSDIERRRDLRKAPKDIAA